MFDCLVHNDVGFFDENRTGELISRISSDTQVVQEGLTTAVAMVVREIAKIVVVCVIIGFYSWKLALVTAGCLAPSVIVTRLAWAWMAESGELV